MVEESFDVRRNYATVIVSLFENIKTDFFKLGEFLLLGSIKLLSFFELHSVIDT